MRSGVEVCVETVASALAAQEGGADRVELCVERAADGLTPSQHEIVAACRKLEIPVHVLIRPRTGDFFYSGKELSLMRFAIRMAKQAGAAGVVFGVLRDDHTVAGKRNAALVELARPMSVTFHKAFDLIRDPFEAIDELIELGVDRVLTSGQAPTAREGAELLADLVKYADGHIAVMAGGDITEDDLPALRDAGIEEIHVGSSVFQNGETDSARVRGLVHAWNRALTGDAPPIP